MPAEFLSMHANNKIIIEGITNEGRKFRPSDWAERMSGALSTFGGGRIHYSPLLQPLTTRNGAKCVAMDPSLRQIHPELFRHIINFARANHLNIIGEPEEA